MIKEYGAVGGMIIGRETVVLTDNLPQSHHSHNKTYITRTGIEPGLPRWETDY
jgi:hypothetical protein